MIVTAALAQGHRTPTGLVLVLLIVLAVLYVAWRTGRLGRLRAGTSARRLRAELRGVRISPFSLLPLAVLVIVVAVLLIAH